MSNVLLPSQGAIGVFDSGLGGLTVARAIVRHLPEESLLYVGDTARVPYGPKSPDTVRRYAQQIGDWLVEQGVCCVVIACNTATAHALPVLQASLPVPVIGVVEPGAHAAVAASTTGKIGVIGTSGTINSGAYHRALHALAPRCTVSTVAAPLLVPLVEEGWVDHAVTRLVVAEYLEPLRAQTIDTLVLGCTHYPLLAPLIAEFMGPQVRLIDSADETARAVAAVLVIARGTSGSEAVRSTPTRRFVASDAPQHFLRLGQRFFDASLREVEHHVFT